MAWIPGDNLRGPMAGQGVFCLANKAVPNPEQPSFIDRQNGHPAPGWRFRKGWPDNVAACVSSPGTAGRRSAGFARGAKRAKDLPKRHLGYSELK